MAGKFGIVEVLTTEVSQLFAGDYRALMNVTIVAGQGASIKRGTVMQRNAGTGKYEVLVAGTGTACAVLASAEPVDATADIVVPVLRQGPVRASDLVWPGGITTPQKATHTQQLVDAGVPVID
ncbi:MAG: head decoration protein [Syntrophobacteraceae bacterium]